MSITRAPATTGLVASLFMLVLVPALWSAGSASAQLEPPQAVLWGTGLDQGVVVAASIDGTECGTSTVDAEGAWAIEVAPGDCGGGAVQGERGRGAGYENFLHGGCSLSGDEGAVRKRRSRKMPSG